ncbi:MULTISPECIES: tetratricopeptide repeat-containing diguanylate cyclase [unclassified Clostridium]|uniref:tetratricopeptide repeat-containing diguanylate cyclase n=1 Tax=unclassified Clostridium TaxID=2614128 RepID=UPI00029865D0|nr:MULTISPECIES: tetratricopeptide repeat-containing diguanylate cyclase [unclassified Clostridium]EKQ53309.1 MAG: diguanylate cyclase (GGDEF) domain-containing protein [Clostridium sp. Maddingley MBC34-26]
MFINSENMISFLSNAIVESNNKIILLKGSSDLSLSEFHKYVVEKNLSDKCFYMNLKKNYSFEPFYPFLSFIKEELIKSGGTASDFLDSNSIYPSQRNVFYSFISNGLASREEEMIPFDYQYEKNKLYQSFFNIFNKYSDESKVFVLFENINYMPYSSLQWLKWLVENEKTYNFRFILTISTYTYYKSEMQDEFENFIETVEAGYSLLQVDSNQKNEELENVLSSQNDSEINFLNAGENYYQFLALDEALYCFNKRYEVIKKNERLIEDKELESIFSRLGDIYLLKDDYHNAYIYYDLLLNKAVELNNERLKIKAYQRLSMLDILKREFSSAEEFAKKSYKISIKIKNNYLKLKAYELLFWINELGKYRTTIENLGFEEEFITLAKMYNKKNSLAYFLTHSFNSLSFRGPSDQREDYYNQGHALAEELKNENCILSAHLKTALVYAVNGFHNVSNQYYEKVEKLLIEMKDDFRLAQTYNGIGYYYLTAGKYKDANKYYDKALQHLKTEWNFDEICITLVNKSINAILVSDYISAEKQLEILLSVIKELKLSRLRLTTLSRIYGIIALNHFFLGNSYKSYSFLSKMQTVISPNKFYEDDDEYFLNNFTQGLLLRKEGKLDKAEEFFQEAWFHLCKIKGSLKCLYPKFTLEYQQLLIKCGKFLDSDSIIRRGYNYCRENCLEYYLNLLQGKESENYNFGSYLSELTWISEAAKQEASIRLLNDKVEEINFINNFQEILASSDNNEDMISSCLTLLENKFSLHYSLLILYDNNAPQIMYSSDKRKILNHRLKYLESIICNYKLPFVSNENVQLNSYIEDITSEKIKSLIYIPIIKNDKLKVVYLCATQIDNDLVNNNIILNSSNLRIINIVIRQLSETIQKIQTQEKLIASVSTDMLTGLFNRQYFYNRMSNLIEASKDDIKSYNASLYLFYIDLDNFKYYNDNFGHTVGDYVLIWFGEILKTVLIKKSSAIRYGGDEFLLLLEECDEKKAIKVVKKIYDKLEAEDGFKKKINKVLGSKIDIPTKNLLSCSIGISHSYLNEKLNISEFIDNADKCLYKAKRLGKNRYEYIR